MMLFNPLFLQNESGTENLFIAKPGVLKKKGYLFADIMKVYFNDKRETNPLNSKLKVSETENKPAVTELSKNGETVLSLLTKGNTGGIINAKQTNSSASNTPVVNVNLNKLENILAKLLGKNGDGQTVDLQKLIEQLVSQLNSKGEIVLSVEQNGEKVAVDVSKIELIGSADKTITSKNSADSQKEAKDSQNYAIKIVAVAKDFNLLNLTQKISSSLPGEINISEVKKIDISVPGKKGKRVITAFSVETKGGKNKFAPKASGKLVIGEITGEGQAIDKQSTKLGNALTADKNSYTNAVDNNEKSSKFKKLVTTNNSSAGSNPKNSNNSALKNLKTTINKPAIKNVPGKNIAKQKIASTSNDNTIIANSEDSANKKIVIESNSKVILGKSAAKVNVEKTIPVENEAAKAGTVKPEIQETIATKKNITITKLKTAGSMPADVSEKSGSVKTNTANAKIGIEKSVSKINTGKIVPANKEDTITKLGNNVSKPADSSGETAPVKTSDLKNIANAKIEIEKTIPVEKEVTTIASIKSSVKNIGLQKNGKTKENKIFVKTEPANTKNSKINELLKDVKKNTEPQKTIIKPAVKENQGPGEQTKTVITNSGEIHSNNAAVVENQAIENAGVITPQSSKNIKSHKVNNNGKDTNETQSSDGNKNKIGTKSKTVHEKENKQQSHNFESNPDTKDNFDSKTRNDSKEKSTTFNIHNFQSSNLKENSLREFSNIFGKSEKTIKLAEIVKEFSQFIKKKEKTTLVLQLDPKKLGKVKITLDVAKEVIKAHIEVETNAAKQTVQNNLQELYTQLNQSGINLGQVNITLHEGNNKEAKQFANKRKNNSSLNSKEDFADEEENKTTRKLGYNTYEFFA